MNPADRDGSQHPLSVTVSFDEGCESASTLLPRIKHAVVAAAAECRATEGEIGVLVTDDANIREINRRHLNHDYATDVISFAYEYRPPRIEGEMVVSLTTATRQAATIRWRSEDELLLYVVHGTLHLAGMDDGTADQRSEMRQSERRVLMSLGIHDVDAFHADRFPALDDIATVRTLGEAAP